MYQNELYHHGILGMKWGKRNGPPYPLTGSQKNSAEKQQSKKTRSSSDMSDSELQNYIKRKNLEKQYDKLSNKGGGSSKLEGTKRAIDETSNVVNRLRNLQRNIPKQNQPTKKLDLSNMSDKELRDRINRANLEKQYNSMFGEHRETVSKGETYAREILDIGGDVLAVASSAVAIALAVKQIRGK